MAERGEVVQEDVYTAACCQFCLLSQSNRVLWATHESSLQLLISLQWWQG